MAWMMNQFPGMFSEDSLAIMGLERALMDEDTRANLDGQLEEINEERSDAATLLDELLFGNKSAFSLAMALVSILTQVRN